MKAKANKYALSKWGRMKRFFMGSHFNPKEQFAYRDDVVKALEAAWLAGYKEGLTKTK